MPEVSLHRGRLATHPRILAVRPLTRDDLAALRQPRVAPRARIFRDTHHRLARLVASGLRDQEILRQTGYSSSRFGIFKADPAFQELVAQYRQKVTEAFVASQDEFYETSTSNMLRAERQIEEHLDRADEEGELVPLKTLLAITSDRADRFGYPKKKEIDNNFNIDFAKRIEQVMARTGRGSVIDARANLLPGPLAPMAPEAESAPAAPQAPTSSAGSGRAPAEAAVGLRRRF